MVTGGSARRRAIKTGHSNGLDTEILDRLEAGAEVAVYADDKL